jgi:hypothetical protein
MTNTNREILENAGILVPGQTLTSEQYEAIEGLSEAEVNELISIKNRLADLSESVAGGPIQPGINPVGP